MVRKQHAQTATTFYLLGTVLLKSRASTSTLMRIKANHDSTDFPCRSGSYEFQFQPDVSSRRFEKISSRFLHGFRHVLSFDMLPLQITLSTSYMLALLSPIMATDKG